MTSWSLWVMMTMALPSAFMLRMHVEEPVGLLGGQHGGGLIQDQDVGAPVEDLDDLHRLLLRHGHVVDLLVGVDAKSRICSQISRILAEAAFRSSLRSPSSPRTMFSAAVNTSTSLKCWWIMPMPQVKGVLGGGGW